MGIAEAATTAMISIWFCAGGIAAIIACKCGCAFGWQAAISGIVSAVCFAAFCKFGKKERQKAVSVNLDSIIGKECIVCETISNINETGAIKIDGKIWTARSENKEITIPENTVVIISKIDGVKAIVKINHENTKEEN